MVINADESSCTYLGVDLGASSGRVMAGWLANDHLSLDEVHRFENNPIEIDGSLCWNFEGLMSDIKFGLKAGISEAREQGRPVTSIGIDSWAVDFGLIDDSGSFVGPVVHYRDSRTDGQMQKVFASISRERIFEITGIQFLPFNTIYQLAALKEQHPELLSRAKHFMMIADLVAWELTGQVTCEYTNATTTQLFDTRECDWSEDLIKSLDLPRAIFPPVVTPRSVIGKLKATLANDWNAPDVEVVAVATHDTGSAVVGVPATTREFAYLSCGTWSLLGTEVAEPVLSPEALAANFTNEGGAHGTIRLLKNIMGLWILQECRRDWARQGTNYSWNELEQMARENAAFASRIDVDDPRFLPPGDMAKRVSDYCRDYGLAEPENDGAVVACILRSLASRYFDVLELTESLTGERYEGLYMVGGGIQNQLLCQWTAEAIGRPVWAGPAEATVLGNIAMQISRDIESPGLMALRGIIRDSFPPHAIHP